MEILKNAYRIPVLNVDDTQGIVNILNSPEFQEIYSFYTQQIPDSSVLNNLPELEKKFGFYFQYTGQEEYLSQMEQILYCKHLPTINEFLRQPEYMGNSWGITYPYWRNKLLDMFSPGKRVFECLTGDTKIPLLNGTTKTIKELFESNTKGEYTYSWDQENYKFVPGEIEQVVYNGKRRVYKITLDNGKTFRVTGNHKILMRNNKWRRVDKLSVGDSLMPFDKINPLCNILSIDHLNDVEDVYDICIMGPHHNFSLDAGCIVHNCIYRGAIGTGKTTIARRAAAYCIYRLCCLRNPHALFNIAPDTVISALMISVVLEQAEVTVFNPMLQMIRQTPCFKEVRKETSFSSFGPGDPVPFVKSGRRIIFPNNILLTVGSNINHVIGQSSAIVVMDEAEEKNPKDAFYLYTAMRGRIKSRFLDSSLTMCSLISSSKSKNGMVWEYIKNIPKNDPTVMLMEPPIWDVKDAVFDYNKGRFWVQVGTKTNPSVILPKEYDNIPEDQLTYVPPPGCRLISVPYEYRRDFENNIEKYLQDYGGITTDTSDRPFDDLSQLGSPGLLPEVHLEANIGDPVPLIDKLPKSLFINTPNGRRLARYPSAKRFIHIDLASRDSAQAGYSMFHVEYIMDENNEKIPVFVADFISWISASNRIDHEAINNLALDLKHKAGVTIEAISYDQFQSEAIRQKLKKSKEFENVLYQSVDRTNEAYWNFSQYMMKGRIKIGECPYLREQLSNIGLEDGKVLTTQKKDMADSCLSADTQVFLLSGKKVSVSELYKMNIEKEWILACDIQNRRLAPVKIERVIKKDFIPKSLYKFNLSNGESFSVTEDHLVLKKNKEYSQAFELKEGDELMPFNYYHELNYHDRYRKVVNPFTGSSQFLYKLVSKSVMMDKIDLAKKRAEQDGSKFTVIHHVNHNKNNDTPENLLPLTNIEHTNLHAMSGKEIQAFHDRSVFKRERSKIINSGLALMRRVNPEGYRRYIVEHDVETKLAEKKAKSENTHVYIESIEVIPNDDYVYDIVLNSIHNFALECGVFVHNCVGAVHNAEVYLPSSLEYAYYETEQQEESLSSILGFDKEEYDLEEI